jgi:predicted nucleic-acid-binding protein
VIARLDTNVLVRHFTGSPVDHARRATAYLRGAAPASLFLTDVHLAELVYVLKSSIHATPRETVATIVNATLAFPAIKVDDEALLRRTLDLYRDQGMDWEDAYLVASALGGRALDVVSFDRFDGKLKGLPLRRVGPLANPLMLSQWPQTIRVPGCWEGGRRMSHGWSRTA